MVNKDEYYKSFRKRAITVTYALRTDGGRIPPLSSEESICRPSSASDIIYASHLSRRHVRRSYRSFFRSFASEVMLSYDVDFCCAAEKKRF